MSRSVRAVVPCWTSLRAHWPLRATPERRRGASGMETTLAAYEGVVVRTALVKSWYDAGARL